MTCTGTLSNVSSTTANGLNYRDTMPTFMTSKLHSSRLSRLKLAIAKNHEPYRSCQYIKQIIAMPPHISKSMLVRNLFKPKPGQDFEIDPNALNDDYRLSDGSQQSLQRIQSNQAGEPQMSGGYGGMGPPPNQRASHQRQQPSVSGGAGYGGIKSPNGDRPYLHNQASNLTQNSQTSIPQSQQQLKAKIYWQEDTFVMRFPQDVAYAELLDRVQQRLKTRERLLLSYEDRMSGGLVPLGRDQDLDIAIDRAAGAQLKIHVSYANG
jgi:bud emergence protein 1